MNIEDSNEEIFYNSSEDYELILKLKNAKKLCFEFNNLDVDREEDRKKIMKKLFKKIGKDFYIESIFWCDLGSEISVGDNFYMNHNCVILDIGGVEFGNNVFVGPNCGFYTSEHPIDSTKRNKGLEYAKKIKIGDNVWIGGNVTILSGVIIGDNVTIGAGSVVTKNIPSNVIAVGNPCKVLREISK